MIDIMHETEEVSTESKGGAKAVVFTLILCLIGAVAGGIYYVKTRYQPVTPVVDTQASMSAVKAADTQWAKAPAAHDVETTLSYYADVAYAMPPNQEMASNKSSIRKIWTDRLAKGTDVTWTPGVADISSAGDLVYLEGYYIDTTKPAKGKGAPSLERGKYLSVWKKQADGTWKVVANTWNSDMPAKK